ncbi:MAG: NlpC/P60 family protein [Eubacterium sp.]|nr:NlpC/P60 family protein [Eubacterium sp.]
MKKRNRILALAGSIALAFSSIPAAAVTVFAEPVVSEETEVAESLQENDAEGISVPEEAASEDNETPVTEQGVKQETPSTAETDPASGADETVTDSEGEAGLEIANSAAEAAETENSDAGAAETKNGAAEADGIEDSSQAAAGESEVNAEETELKDEAVYGSDGTVTSSSGTSENAVAAVDDPGVPMYRLFLTSTGEHFYTANEKERDTLVLSGWNFEGVGWVAPTKSDQPVYRLCYPLTGDHHYTMKAAEKDWLVSCGWRDEGIGWYSDPNETVPLYRQYNPQATIGAHNYTSNKGENDYLAQHGWNAEGIGWYGLKAGYPLEIAVKTPEPKDWQNPAGYYQVSRNKVQTPHAPNNIFNYVSPSKLASMPSPITRKNAVDAFVATAYGYLGTPYVWDYACAPGVGVDCVGLVMQACYGAGMNLGSGHGAYDFNPYNHYYTGASGWHSHDANNFWNGGKGRRLGIGARQYGDLISWNGHIAIYVGNDTIIEAYPGVGVHKTSLWAHGTPRGVIRIFA